MRAKIFEAVKRVFTYIKQEGILSSLVEIFKILTLEYREAKNIYEILKTLGEDLAEIIVTIILAYFTGGVTIFQKIKQFIVALKELAQKTAKGAYEAFREAVDNLKRKFKETDGSSRGEEDINPKPAEDVPAQPDDKTNERGANKTPNSYKKIPYNTGLSKLAIRHRKPLKNPFHRGNICVLEYKNSVSGKIETKVFVSAQEGKRKFHAEELVVEWIKESKLEQKNILKLTQN